VREKQRDDWALSFLSLARRFARLIYREGHVYPVPFGPLRGLKLYYEAQVNVREMLGLWEKQTFVLLALLKQKGLLGEGGDVVYDVGANFGLYGMYLARRLRHMASFTRSSRRKCPDA
jgi:hypothetical protein